MMIEVEVNTGAAGDSPREAAVNALKRLEGYGAKPTEGVRVQMESRPKGMVWYADVRGALYLDPKDVS